MDGFDLKIAEAACLGTSLGLSGLFYYMYRKTRATIDKLENAPHLTIDGKLSNILKAAPGACLQYAVIEGTVKPVDECLTSQFHKGVVGVQRKFVVKEHRLVWNSLARAWLDDRQVVHKRVNAVPFLLVGSDETAVKVLSPLQASGMKMEITYMKFHQASFGFSDLIGQYLSGHKLKGQMEIEKMLKVGSTVTGIGELTLNTDSTLNLQPPTDGSEYFLSMADFDTLKANCESTAAGWRTLAVASAFVGAAVLFWVGLRYYYHRKACREQEQERMDFQRQQAEALRRRGTVTGPEAPQGQADNDTNNICVICLGRPRDCILLNCGHMCCCFTCFEALPQRKCPICRQDISRVVPFFHT